MPIPEIDAATVRAVMHAMHRVQLSPAHCKAAENLTEGRELDEVVRQLTAKANCFLLEERARVARHPAPDATDACLHYSETH